MTPFVSSITTMEPILSRFRHEASNVRYTKSLFLEESYEDKSNVLYTLKDSDHPSGYVSLYRKYLECNDPTEIDFARTYFESWEHWQMICSCSWFKPYITRWRHELELKIRADALNSVIQVARDPSHKSSYEANKYLLSGNWKDRTDGKVGRPSKEAIKAQAEELFKDRSATQEDLKRISEA